VGLVLKDGTVLELLNISNTPDDAFEAPAEDMLKYADMTAVTWHTHVRGDANLSADDYHAFLCWPSYLHVIIFNADVRGFYVNDDGALIADDDKDHPSWGLVRDLAERLPV
jgi:proteasome lid subunit RPN8/RPN11